MGPYAIGFLLCSLLLAANVVCETLSNKLREQEVCPKTSETIPKCLINYDLSVTKRICETKNVVKALLLSQPSNEKGSCGRLKIVEKLFDTEEWKFQQILRYSVSENASSDCLKLLKKQSRQVYLITERNQWTEKDGVITGLSLDHRTVILAHNEVNEKRVNDAYEKCEAMSKDEESIFQNDESEMLSDYPSKKSTRNHYEETLSPPYHVAYQVYPQPYPGTPQVYPQPYPAPQNYPKPAQTYTYYTRASYSAPPYGANYSYPAPPPAYLYPTYNRPLNYVVRETVRRVVYNTSQTYPSSVYSVPVPTYPQPYPAPSYPRPYTAPSYPSSNYSNPSLYPAPAYPRPNPYASYSYPQPYPAPGYPTTNSDEDSSEVEPAAYRYVNFTNVDRYTNPVRKQNADPYPAPITNYSYPAPSPSRYQYPPNYYYPSYYTTNYSYPVPNYLTQTNYSYPAPSYPSYHTPSYPSYPAHSYPSYPPPSNYSYPAPSYPSYTAPSYPSYPPPSNYSYPAPSYPSYTAPSYPSHYSSNYSYPAPSNYSYPAPSYPNYPPPSNYSYPSPSYPSYTAPSYPSYPPPSNYSYPAPSYPSYPPSSNYRYPAPSYPSYPPTNYSYPAPSYPSHPAPSNYSYPVPSYLSYPVPSYPSYPAPSNYSYPEPSYPSYPAPSNYSYPVPSYPSYPAPSYLRYPAPSYPSYPTSSNYSYPVPSYPSYPTSSNYSYPSPPPSYPSYPSPSYPSYHYPVPASPNYPSYPSYPNYSYPVPSYPSYTSPPYTYPSYGNESYMTSGRYFPAPFVAAENYIKTSIPRSTTLLTTHSLPYAVPQYACKAYPAQCPPCLDKYDDYAEESLCGYDYVLTVDIQPRYEHYKEKQCHVMEVFKVLVGESKSLSPIMFYNGNHGCQCDFLQNFAGPAIFLLSADAMIRENEIYVEIDISKVKVLRYSYHNLVYVHRALPKCQKPYHPIGQLVQEKADDHLHYGDCPEDDYTCPLCYQDFPELSKERFCKAKFAIVFAYGLDLKTPEQLKVGTSYERPTVEVRTLDQKGQELYNVIVSNKHEKQLLYQQEFQLPTSCAHYHLRGLFNVNPYGTTKSIDYEYTIHTSQTCGCSVLERGPGYAILLSDVEIPESKYEIQLTNKHAIYGLPYGPAKIPKCGDVVQGETQQLETHIPPPPMPNSTYSLPDYDGVPCPDYIGNTCPNCLPSVTPIIEDIFCGAKFVGVIYVQGNGQFYGVGNATEGPDNYKYYPKIVIEENPYKAEREVRVETSITQQKSELPKVKRDVYGGRCLRGALYVEQDVTPYKSYEPVHGPINYIIKKGCSCPYLEYPIGYALLISPDRPIHYNGSDYIFSSEVYVVPLSHGKTSLPSCKRTHEHSHHIPQQPPSAYNAHAPNAEHRLYKRHSKDEYNSSSPDYGYPEPAKGGYEPSNYSSPAYPAPAKGGYETSYPSPVVYPKPVSYPSPSYPAPSYPGPSYHAPSYPAPAHYAAPSYPAPAHYPAPSYSAPAYSKPYAAKSYPEPAPYPAKSYPEPAPYPAKSYPEPAPYPAKSYPEPAPYPAKSYHAPAAYSPPTYPSSIYQSKSYPIHQVNYTLPADYPTPNYTAPYASNYSIPLYQTNYTLPAPVEYPAPAHYSKPGPYPEPYPKPAPYSGPYSGPAPHPAPYPGPAPYPAPYPGPAPYPAPYPGPAPYPAPYPGPAPYPAPYPGPAPYPAPYPGPAPYHASYPSKKGGHSSSYEIPIYTVPKPVYYNAYKPASYPVPGPVPSYPAPVYYPAPKPYYSAPKPIYYPAPSYPAPSYPAPSYPSYSNYSAPYSAPKPYYAPKPQYYSAPKPVYYPAPKPAYPSPSYPAPSYPAPSYPVPKPAYYEVPSYPKPSYPKPSYPEPSYPKPSYPEPSYPKPSYPEPSYPKHSYPEPSYPKHSYPEPSYPKPSYPEPSYPKPSYPEPSYHKHGHPEPSYHKHDHPEPSYHKHGYPEPSYPKPSYPEPTYQEEYPKPAHAGAKYKRDISHVLENPAMPRYVRKDQHPSLNSYASSSSGHQPYYNPKPIKHFPSVYAPRPNNYDSLSYPQRDEPTNPPAKPVGYAQPRPISYPRPVAYVQRDPTPKIANPGPKPRPVEYGQPEPKRVENGEPEAKPRPIEYGQPEPKRVENGQPEAKPRPIEYAQPNASLPRVVANDIATRPSASRQPNPSVYRQTRPLVNPEPRPVSYRQSRPIANNQPRMTYRRPNPESYPQPGSYYYPQPEHNPYYQHDPYTGQPYAVPYYQPQPVVNAVNPRYVNPVPTVNPNTCPFGKPMTCANYYHDLDYDLKSQLCSYHYILLLEIGRVNDVLEETYNRTGISHQCGMAKVIRSQKGFIRNFAPKLFFTNLLECYGEYLHLKSYILVIANVPSFVQASNGQIVGIKFSKNVNVLSFTHKTVGEINAILNNCLSKGSQPLPLRFLTADGKKSDYYECPQKNECPKCLKNTPLSYEDLYCSSQYATVVALGLDYTYVNPNSTELIFKRRENFSPTVVYEPTRETYASINVEKMTYAVDKDDLDYTKCYRETIRMLYDVSYNKIPTVINQDINTYMASKCDCLFLKSDPGYYLILSQTPVIDPSYNLMQLGKGYVTLPLPIGTLTLPKCRPDYQKVARDNLLFAEKNVPISTKPREPAESVPLPKAAPLVQCLGVGEQTCAHCLTHFTKELEYEYCQADFVYIFKILDEPGVNYQSIYSPEISVASAPTYTKLRIHGSYQHPLGQDDYEPSHRHKRDTKAEPLQCLNGFIYSECAPAPGCEPTCDSYYNIHCYKRTCHKGCVCPEGMVRKENHCVKPQDCVHQSDGAQCYSGKIQILVDLKKRNDTGQIIKYFIGGFCSCQYLEYPIGSALIFSRKNPLGKLSQLNDEFHIVNLPHGQTDLPVCPKAHHHHHHHHDILDNYNQFHAHPHPSHPHPQPAIKKTCPLSQPKTCLICEREIPDSCLFDDVMKISVLKLPTPQECGEVQLLELYTDSKHVRIQFSITMNENCCDLSQGEEVILFTNKTKWVVKDDYTSGLVLDNEVVLVKHSYKAASKISEQMIQCPRSPVETQTEVLETTVTSNQSSLLTNQTITPIKNTTREKPSSLIAKHNTSEETSATNQNADTTKTKKTTSAPYRDPIKTTPYKTTTEDLYTGFTSGPIDYDNFGAGKPNPYGQPEYDPYAAPIDWGGPEPDITTAPPQQENLEECSSPSGECPQCSTRVKNIGILTDICKIDYILKVEIYKIPKAGGGYFSTEPPSNCGGVILIEALRGDLKDFPEDKILTLTQDPSCRCKQLAEGHEVILAAMNENWQKKDGKLSELKVVGTTGILDIRRYDEIKGMLTEC